jgi:RNA polymerase sigma-70 factor (ECF subfamily)
MRLRRHNAVEWSVTSPDEDLVTWAQRGEREAFGLLYDRHFGGVYGYCYRRLADREAAQDAAGETFRKALAGLAGYQRHAFRGWLFAIARHVVTDTLRERRPEVGLETIAVLADPEASVEVVALRRVEVAAVVALLPSLTPEQQDVIAMRLTGLSPAEIGVALGKSRSAVDMAQHRAARRLRELLAGTPEPMVGGCHG